MTRSMGPGGVQLKKTKAYIKVIWKPKTGQCGKPEREYEMVLKKTLQSICLLNVHPNTTTSIVIQVVNDDGDVSFMVVITLLPCAINASCAALVDAGIPLKHLAAAICCCMAEGGHFTRPQQDRRIESTDETNEDCHKERFSSLENLLLIMDTVLIPKETVTHGGTNDMAAHVTIHV